MNIDELKNYNYSLTNHHSYYPRKYLLIKYISINIYVSTRVLKFLLCSLIISL